MSIKRGSDFLTATDSTLIDLLSERHHLMRSSLENRWNEEHDVSISNSEWYILSKVYKDKKTISQIAKEANLTRQAVHKHVKNLLSKGLVETNQLEFNKKGKLIQLTELGNDYFKKYNQLKLSLEATIAEYLSDEQLSQLKKILNEDWGIVMEDR